MCCLYLRIYCSEGLKDQKILDKCLSFFLFFSLFLFLSFSFISHPFLPPFLALSSSSLSLSLLFFLSFMATPVAYESSWARAESKLQLQAYPYPIATPDLSHIYDLCCSLWQCWIFNPLSHKGNTRTFLFQIQSEYKLINVDKSVY